MTLAECKEQIEKCRAEARRLRRKADAEDVMADVWRAEAAKLATPQLFTGMEGDPRGSYAPDGTFRID